MGLSGSMLIRLNEINLSYSIYHLKKVQPMSFDFICSDRTKVGFLLFVSELNLLLSYREGLESSCIYLCEL